MINRLQLQQAINKYHLGLCESVMWEIKDNVLSIDFMTPNKNVIGKITKKDIPLEDCKLPIFNTKKLLSLIGICNGDLLVELEKNNTAITKILISDMNFNLSYALSDPLLIEKVGKVNEPEWTAEAELSHEDVLNIIKAKSALNEIDNLIVSTEKNEDDKPMVVLTLGDEAGHNNNIKYYIEGNIQTFGTKVPFDSNILKTILQANKTSELGKMYLSDRGLMKLEFTSEDSTSEYFLVRKEDTNF